MQSYPWSFSRKFVKLSDKIVSPFLDEMNQPACRSLAGTASNNSTKWFNLAYIYSAVNKSSLTCRSLHFPFHHSLFYSTSPFLFLSLSFFLPPPQDWEFAHSLICSFRSNQMSGDCERFAQISQDKWATQRKWAIVSDSLRSLRGNEQSERIAHLAHEK